MSASGPSPESAAWRERTGLAWQRTGMSILGSSLILLRLSGARGGWATVILILAGGLLGLFSSVESRRRGLTGSTLGMGDGRVAMLMSVAVTLLLLAELDVVLLAH